ncbi:uncharacterized protein LOC117299416 [Asterias rubens]|uniref:uncharacterized protein LOC117299416 n=1 Tax=Asterias rubens TaxID=7604 RepID=UPI0014554ED2|nr:uncharacterized protein LOC117299416 [Asterias rubens]
MDSSLRLMLLVMVLSACLGGLDGFDCYLCGYDNSLPDNMPSCNDPFDVSDPSISETAMQCEGVCSKSSVINGNITAVSRECLEDIILSDCDNECSTNDELGTVCYHCCDTDRCNSADSMTYDLLTSFIAFAFSLYWTIS